MRFRARFIRGIQCGAKSAEVLYFNVGFRGRISVGFSVVTSLIVSFQNRDLGVIQVRSL